MAIQFLCAACRQPIEVDDEAANQVVTCPYCRKVVTAPANSDTSVHRGIPDARSTPEPAMGQIMPPLVPTLGNRVGWAALACTTVMILCGIIAMGMWLSVLRHEGLLDQPDQAKLKEFMEQQQKSPGPAIRRTGNLMCISILFGLISLPLGIMGVVGNRRPKWPAVTSLIVCGLLVLLMCVAFAIGIAAIPRGGGAA